MKTDLYSKFNDVINHTRQFVNQSSESSQMPSIGRASADASSSTPLLLKTKSTLSQSDNNLLYFMPKMQVKSMNERKTIIELDFFEHSPPLTASPCMEKHSTKFSFSDTSRHEKWVKGLGLKKSSCSAIGHDEVTPHSISDDVHSVSSLDSILTDHCIKHKNSSEDKGFSSKKSLSESLDDICPITEKSSNSFEPAKSHQASKNITKGIGGSVLIPSSSYENISSQFSHSHPLPSSDKSLFLARAKKFPDFGCHGDRESASTPSLNTNTPTSPVENCIALQRNKGILKNYASSQEIWKEKISELKECGDVSRKVSFNSKIQKNTYDPKISLIKSLKKDRHYKGVGAENKWQKFYRKSFTFSTTQNAFILDNNTHTVTPSSQEESNHKEGKKT